MNFNFDKRQRKAVSSFEGLNRKEQKISAFFTYTGTVLSLILIIYSKIKNIYNHTYLQLFFIFLACSIYFIIKKQRLLKEYELFKEEKIKNDEKINKNLIENHHEKKFIYNSKPLFGEDEDEDEEDDNE